MMSQVFRCLLKDHSQSGRSFSGISERSGLGGGVGASLETLSSDELLSDLWNDLEKTDF